MRSRDGVWVEIMNGHDVRMAERRDCLRLLMEPRQTVRIARVRGGQDFDSNVAVEPCIPRTVDFAHPPAPAGATTSYGPSLVPGFRAMCAPL